MANIIKNFFKEFEEITDYYNFLVNKTKNHEYVEITNEWLIDNYYILVEHKNNILCEKKQLKKNIKVITENYYFLKNILNKKNYNIDFRYLVEELKKYQKENNKIFTYKELSSVFPTLILIYTDRLATLCKEEHNRLLNKEKVATIIKNNENLTLKSFINDSFDISSNSNYLFEINNQLSKIGSNSNEIFKDLNEYLKENSISLKEVINEEYQKRIDNNILVANIFSDFKEFFEFSCEELFEKVSKTEKKLLEDPYYKAMTMESKLDYREQIVRQARKKHMGEYAYLEKIFDPEEHIGFQLFKQTRNTWKVISYLSTLFVLTSIICYFLSAYLIKPRILGFILLYIPISQLLKQIINELLIYIVPTRSIHKLDYSKGIPKESKTMVVIPTIVANKEKIKEMFDTLESFYLVNKTDNLYFTLLGDVKASDTKVMDYDKEISDYGKEYAEKLNAKYKKDLFYFMYRKRL